MLQERNASGFDPLLLVTTTCSFATQQSSENSTRMLELLLQHGADANSHDETKGETALYSVIRVHKNTEAMDLLLRYGAQLAIQSTQQVSPRSLLYSRAKLDKAEHWHVQAARTWLPQSYQPTPQPEP